MVAFWPARIRLAPARTVLFTSYGVGRMTVRPV
jgi:hypothetical protein